MFECHGWIKISETSEEVDDGGLDEKVTRLRELVRGVDWSSGKLDVLLLNGIYFLNINLNANRRRSEASELDDVLKYVNAELPGSHGVLYVLDEDGDDINMRQSYCVRVVKNGRVNLELDSFLSPVN